MPNQFFPPTSGTPGRHSNTDPMYGGAGGMPAPPQGQMGPQPPPNGVMPPPPGGATPAPDGYNGYQQPSPADYQSVQQYSDQAYGNARRYLDPQQDLDNRRYQQEMINKGLDPNSAMGQQMYDNMQRTHGDQDQGAAYGAMQFGQGIQDQMYKQNFMSQGQDFGQMMDLEGVDFRNRSYADSQQQYLDQLILSMYGMNPVPNGSQILPPNQNNGGWNWGWNNQGP
jgi:hypothetical protein